MREVRLEPDASLAMVGAMKMLVALGVGLMATGWLCAQEKGAGSATGTGTGPAATSAVAAATKAEPFLLLPEPREMRTAHSVVLGDAKKTVFSPVRREAGETKLVSYSKAEF